MLYSFCLSSPSSPPFFFSLGGLYNMFISTTFSCFLQNRITGSSFSVTVVNIIGLRNEMVCWQLYFSCNII